jgi:hypothetical protein
MKVIATGRTPDEINTRHGEILAGHVPARLVLEFWFRSPFGSVTSTVNSGRGQRARPEPR